MNARDIGLQPGRETVEHPRAARIMLQVQVFMLALILLAAARAHDQFDGGNPLTWLLLAGFVAAVASAAVLSVVMDARREPASGP